MAKTYDVSVVKFPPGRFVATPGAIEAFATTGDNPGQYIVRHLTGDWGDLDKEDMAANEMALVAGYRLLLSAYHLSDGTKIWIITEADRSATTILLPEEY